MPNLNDIDKNWTRKDMVLSFLVLLMFAIACIGVVGGMMLWIWTLAS